MSDYMDALGACPTCSVQRWAGTRHVCVTSGGTGDPGVRRTVYFELREQQRKVLKLLDDAELTASSPILKAFDKRAILEKTDPLLALAFYVEAVADGRTQGGVDAYSKIASLQQEARRMLRQVGAPLERVAELYPRYGELSQSPAHTK